MKTSAAVALFVRLLEKISDFRTCGKPLEGPVADDGTPGDRLAFAADGS
jgi:hypothetical protein